MRPLPDQSYLLSILEYDEHTGVLTWLPRPLSEFYVSNTLRRAAICETWNKRFAGKQAFTAISCGYHVGAVRREIFLAHRVIWKMVYGSDPIGVDHIDGNRQNNRLVNLREADQAINSKNSSMSKANTSGRIGVAYHKQAKRWRAYITVDRKQLALGLFTSIEDAIEARRDAEHFYGFHENHGKRAA